MAEEETRQCSSCGTPVPASENECSYCGLNLDTGESYEVRVKKARQDRNHKVAPLSTVLMLPVIAFGLAVFAGWMYQSRAESALESNSSTAEEYVERLKKVDVLVQFGEVSKARETCQKLVDDLESGAGGGDGEGGESVMLNLEQKAKHKLKKLSE